MEESNLGPRSLVVLRQQDIVPVRLAGPHVVSPSGSVVWTEMEIIATIIITAVVSILGLPDNGHKIERFSGLTPPNSPVGIVISATQDEVGDAVLEQVVEIRSVAQEYLKRIQEGGRIGQSDLLGSASKFDKSLEARLQAQVLTDLAEIGGKPIKAAMVLEFGSENLILRGKLGEKPPQAPKAPERFETVGRVVGLNSHRKRLHIFSTEEIEIECDPTLFASLLRDAIHTPRCFVFGVLHSADAKGREQLVLTDVKEIDSPPDDPQSLF